MAFLPDKTASLGRPHASNTPTISPISHRVIIFIGRFYRALW